MLFLLFLPRDSRGLGYCKVRILRRRRRKRLERQLL